MECRAEKSASRSDESILVEAQGKEVKSIAQESRESEAAPSYLTVIRQADSSTI
jgi:hypothetical protein